MVFLFKAGNVAHLSERIIELLAQLQKVSNTVHQKHENIIDHKNIIANGREYVESVRNWQNSVSHYLPVYQSLLSL